MLQISLDQDQDYNFEHLSSIRENIMLLQMTYV